MPTKKKVAVKTSTAKNAAAKGTTAKKAEKPLPKKVTSKVAVKKVARPAETPVAPKSSPVTKVSQPLSKPALPKEDKVEKNTETADLKNTEPTKVMSKKPDVKPIEAPSNEATPPVPLKQLPKKDQAPAKPAKVAMPDIKTKTVRKYEPDFTKSVLDTPMHEQSGPSQRYSDADLAEFRDLINKKLDAAKKELNYLQGLITRKDEMGGDESDNRYMTMEDGSISMEREQLSQMASRQITFIDHLEKAIMRIENKTYGICRVTGKLIDKARLRAVPHATLSIEAKQTMNR